ncbi:MAG TPA: ABC transporter permease [Gemmatimonadaceae bacterium]|nr:ABC transporter permease [Gemmatimonadaceae bacterium]
MLSDLRFALRTLAKSPAFTIAAILCLTLGIGVNATIFSCVRALLLRPFPYRAPDGIVAIGESNLKRGWHMNSVSYPNFRSWQAENRTLESVGIYTGASYNLATGDGADFVPGAVVSWTMFHVLGVTPALGRDFREDEDRVGAPKTIILSDRIWRDRFEAKPGAIGQSITVNGVPHTVIGVMPPGFEFPSTAGAWTTMQTDPLRGRGNHSWEVMGRLKPGVSIEQARLDLNRVASSLSTQYPTSNLGWGVDVQTLRERQSGDLKPVLMLMMASVAFVLLIACANVANLLLARAAVRSKEMAVRVAMGASVGQVVRQMLTESLIIALAGATLGIGFAYGFLQWIKANLLAGIPFWMQFRIDWQVLVFTVAVAVATAFLFGLLPALQAARPNLIETLRDAGARGTSAGRGRQRLRSGLVVAEIALSVVLLVGAALLIRSFMGMQSVKPGFDPGNLLTMQVTLTGPQYDSTFKRQAFWDRFLTGINGRPGIVSAAISNRVPLSGGNNNSFFVPEGQPIQLGSEPLLEIRWASPRYLETLRVPILRGRMWNQQEWADTSASGRVAVINEHMAKQFWKTSDEALGKRFKFGGATDTLNRWITVVGVAADIKHKQLTSEPDFQGYMPFQQGGWSSATIVVRTLGDPTRATPTVLAALKAVDPYVPTYRVLTMDATIQRSYWQQSLYSKMFTAFAAIALALAAVGVYGVISYSVSQRTREIGVRVALGAQRRNVLSLILGHGAVLAAAGIGIGLVGALGVVRLLRSLLFGVSPFDPLSFVAVTVVLSVIAFLASYIPARRAARVDPIEALSRE